MGSPAELFSQHLTHPRGRGALDGWPHSGAAGGAACGDLVRMAVRVERGVVAEAGFAASGCGAAHAAGSAVVELVEGTPVLDAARLTPAHVSAELGGLSPAKHHAAELAADALHRALGAALADGALALEQRPGRVAVAMSGGVDSSVAAQLAAEEGHDVVGVTLELWSHPDTDGERSCCSPQAVTGARALAHRMGIPHVTLDLRDSFRKHVVDDFLAEYERGRTPNPCVRCNGIVRFDALLRAAERLGAGRLATGHYARIERDEQGLLLAAAADPAKDQAYMLARVEPERLGRLWFPLGDLTKTEVRAIAERQGLPVARKPESQDLCFLAGVGRRRFLERHGAPAEPGELVDAGGRVLGSHGGQREFTVGQRRGIGVASSEPLYVIAKDAASGRVTVGPRGQLEAARVSVAPARLHRDARRVDAVKLRYRSKPLPCRVAGVARAGEHASLELELVEPASAVAPGQMACLYEGRRVVGWGTITGPRSGEDRLAA